MDGFDRQRRSDAPAAAAEPWRYDPFPGCTVVTGDCDPGAPAVRCGRGYRDDRRTSLRAIRCLRRWWRNARGCARRADGMALSWRCGRFSASRSVWSLREACGATGRASWQACAEGFCQPPRCRMCFRQRSVWRSAESIGLGMPAARLTVVEGAGGGCGG